MRDFQLIRRQEMDIWMHFLVSVSNQASNVLVFFIRHQWSVRTALKINIVLQVLCFSSRVSTVQRVVSKRRTAGANPVSSQAYGGSGEAAPPGSAQKLRPSKPKGRSQKCELSRWEELSYKFEFLPVWVHFVDCCFDTSEVGQGSFIIDWSQVLIKRILNLVDKKMGVVHEPNLEGI